MKGASAALGALPGLGFLQQRMMGYHREDQGRREGGGTVNQTWEDWERREGGGTVNQTLKWILLNSTVAHSPPTVELEHVVWGVPPTTSTIEWSFHTALTIVLSELNSNLFSERKSLICHG